MKTPAMIACATTLLATLVVAQKPNISLVKGAPTNYGAYGSTSVGWIPLRKSTISLTERTMRLIRGRRDRHLMGFIGKGNYTGTRPCPGHPKDLRHCAGPNGVVTDDFGHVWAGDGAGNLIEADASKPGTATIRRFRPAANSALTSWPTIRTTRF